MRHSQRTLSRILDQGKSSGQDFLYFLMFAQLKGQLPARGTEFVIAQRSILLRPAAGFA
jgi:hypothetical protein